VKISLAPDMLSGLDLSRTQLVSGPSGPAGCLNFLFFTLGIRRPTALERWRLTRPIQPYQFRPRVLVLNWPMAAFDQLSELSLSLAMCGSINAAAIAALLSGKKYVDGNGGSCALAAPAKTTPMFDATLEKT